MLKLLAFVAVAFLVCSTPGPTVLLAMRNGAAVVMRLRAYALPGPGEVSAYMQRVVELRGVRAWIDGALQDQDFLDFEEP